MALIFTGATSDRVDCGTNAGISDLTTWSYIAWVYPTSLGNVRLICSKGTSGVKRFDFNGTTGNIEMLHLRATSSLSYITNDTPLSGTNAWYFVAGTCDTGGTAGSLAALYTGTLTTTVAQRGVTALDGSGALTAEGGQNFIIGNRTNADRAWTGKIAMVGAWNRVLTLAELRDLQFSPRKTSGCVGFWILNGTGTQADWSGSGLPGTVTGATQSSHVPIRRPFRVVDPLVGLGTAAAASSVVPVIDRQYRARWAA